MLGNKIAYRITKVSKNSKQNNSEKITNENDKKITKGRYISPEERQEIIADLRLKVSKKLQQNNSETVTNENDK